MRVFLDQGEKKEALWKLIPKRFRFQPVRLLGCEADGLAGETVLEKTAVDSAYPAGCSDDRYVPVYEFLGFYYLFRGDRWSGAVYQYRSV